MIADFEITPGKEFLKHFLDKRDLFFFSPQMVEKLRTGSDPYSKYGYARWLYITGAHNKENLRIVRDCIEFAVENGIADAMYVLSRLYHNGDYLDENSGIMLLDRKRGKELLAAADSKGSELAKLQRIDDGFLEKLRMKKDVRYLIKKSKAISEKPDASLQWLEQQGWMYEMKGKRDKAIEIYEECVKKGLKYVIFDLAYLYYERGNIAYYQSLMEEGVEKGVPSCYLLGVEAQTEWNDYDDKMRDELHKQLDTNLRRGAEMGCSVCAYFLAEYMFRGLMGFEENIAEALKYAFKALDLGNALCGKLLMDIFFFHARGNSLPPEMNISEDDVLLARLRAVRCASSNHSMTYEILDSHVLEFSKQIKKMGYGEELKYWKELYAFPEDEDDNDNADECEPINPTLLVISPSGYTEFVETKARQVSYTAIIGLIDAEGCDAVHFSAPLNKITKDCGLKKQLVMYVDKNGIPKDLPDNPVATMLYGNAYEIRGAAVVALEDKKYNTHSFDTYEAAEAVYDAINEYVGGLLTCNTEPDDDGRNDAWA